MPRPLRIHLPGGFYHVTLRGNHQHDVFAADGDRRLLNVIVARALGKSDTRLHAYCWMRNHLHFLLQVSEQPLAMPMRSIASEFARAMQSKLETTGHFFERRFHAALVDTDAYLLELIRYIHLNPVRAGVVSDPSEFRWSSHHCYIGTRVEPWVTVDFVLGVFASERRQAVAAYRKFLACGGDTAWEPRLAMPESGIAVIGSDDFAVRALKTAAPRRAGQTLDDLIEEACRRFSIEPRQLQSAARDGYLTKVRAWIAHQAGKRGIATRAAVARALGRSEGTLRYAILAYPGELE